MENSDRSQWSFRSKGKISASSHLLILCVEISMWILSCSYQRNVYGRQNLHHWPFVLKVGGSLPQARTVEYETANKAVTGRIVTSIAQVLFSLFWVFFAGFLFLFPPPKSCLFIVFLEKSSLCAFYDHCQNFRCCFFVFLFSFFSCTNTG